MACRETFSLYSKYYSMTSGRQKLIWLFLVHRTTSRIELSVAIHTVKSFFVLFMLKTCLAYKRDSKGPEQPSRSDFFTYIHVSFRLSGIRRVECWFSNASTNTALVIFRVNVLVGDWQMYQHSKRQIRESQVIHWAPWPKTKRLEYSLVDIHVNKLNNTYTMYSWSKSRAKNSCAKCKATCYCSCAFLS
jgi:hypothetical protein